MSHMVVFRKRIEVGPFEEDIYLQRIMLMPVCPPLGMLVIDGVWECAVTELVWDDNEKRFEAWAEPDDALQCDDVGARIKKWIDMGWGVESA